MNVKARLWNQRPRPCRARRGFDLDSKVQAWRDATLHAKSVRDGTKPQPAAEAQLLPGSALVGRGDFHIFPILGDCAAGDLNAL